MNGEKPSRELSIGEILSLTFNLYFNKFLQFFMPFLISGIITGIFTYAITSTFPMPETPVIPETPSTTFVYEELMPWFFALMSTMVAIVSLMGLLSWFVGTTVSGIVIKNASDQIEKGTSNLGGSFSFAMSKLPSLLIAQFVVSILTVIGLLLLIVPGIIVAIMFSLVIPTIIVEQKGSLESLGRSKDLVHNRWGKTFFLILVLMIIVGIPMVAVNLLTVPLSDIHPILNPLTTNVISAFLSPIFSIGIIYFYYAMVARENPPPTTP
ncbi:MAG: hypothetical protein JSW14_04065 [Candidatus Bathyarchaeum sp.]|nr:MAG: hypothetical protein JSW14_04065 [Candidatus Bathyarchaeum sp.]